MRRSSPCALAPLDRTPEVRIVCRRFDFSELVRECAIAKPCAAAAAVAGTRGGASTRPQGLPGGFLVDLTSIVTGSEEEP